MPPRSSNFTSQFDHIRERMEHARERVIGAPGRPRFSIPFMEPAVDVYETDEAVVVVVEIAGIGRLDVVVEIEGAKLVLRGDRKSADAGGKRNYRQIEITRGPFLREVLLPVEVNRDAALTVYKDGMLQITLPKRHRRASIE